MWAPVCLHQTRHSLLRPPRGICVRFKPSTLLRSQPLSLSPTTPPTAAERDASPCRTHSKTWLFRSSHRCPPLFEFWPIVGTKPCEPNPDFGIPELEKPPQKRWPLSPSPHFT